MAKKFTVLKAAVRSAAGTSPSRGLRGKGLVPAVLYGAGRKTSSIQMDRAVLEAALAHGDRLVTLSIEGADPAERQAMIKDIQYAPVSHRPIHADFQEVRADQTIVVKVKVLLRGTPAGAASGGVTNAVIRELEVECLPVNIPEEIRLDISALAIGDVIRAREVKLPAEVKLATAAEAVVVAVEAPRTEKDLEAAVAVEGAAGPEVLTAKKEEAEGEAAEGAAPAAPAAAEKAAEAKKPEAKEEKK
ncbi:MAG TPA: 50S ribosomal protein L25 [Planctomycetota bacterium]|nr:50S ribosomal protein L25 [Planctomycetota bacterium]